MVTGAQLLRTGQSTRRALLMMRFRLGDFSKLYRNLSLRSRGNHFAQRFSDRFRTGEAVLEAGYFAGVKSGVDTRK